MKRTLVVYLDVLGSDRSYLVSWFITYLRDLQPTKKGALIYNPVATMDIPVGYIGDYTIQLCGEYNKPLYKDPYYTPLTLLMVQKSGDHHLKLQRMPLK